MDSRGDDSRVYHPVLYTKIVGDDSTVYHPVTLAKYSVSGLKFGLSPGASDVLY